MMTRTQILALVLTLSAGTVAIADDWPQWLGPRRDGVWREQGILETFPADGPKVRWRAPVGAGYSGPSVADGRVIITDRILPEGTKNPANAFATDKVNGTERILCLDEKTGKVLWKHEYPCPYEVSYPLGPRASPLIDGDKVYTLGTMGHLFCFDVKTGKELWSKNFRTDYEAPVPLWGFAAHPLLDGDRLICLVGGKGSLVVAFDKNTGKELWKNLSVKEPGYCPPTMIEAGGKRQLIIWHPEGIASLDPATGKEYWSQPWRIRAALSIPTPVQAGDYLFVSSFYNGSLLLKLDRDKPAASVVWESKCRGERPNQTTDLNSIMPTPFIRDGHIYGVCSYGELRCLDLVSGKRLWETFKPIAGESVRWGNAFLVENAGRFFLFNEKGDLVIAKLTPKGYEEISRAHLLDPTNSMPRRPVIWTHPAFANQSVYVRNDKELICFSLAK
ncbi:MAG: PQQ-binding-like beta-propeller repeat protein [Gemmataceae bacterium]